MRKMWKRTAITVMAGTMMMTGCVLEGNVVNLRAFYAMCDAYITHCKGSKNPC